MKVLIIALLMSVLTYADEFSVLYKVEKGEKKLGFYELNMGSSDISSNSYGAANRLEMFSTKNIKYTKDGLKVVSFEKNKKTQNFNVVTKLSVLDNDTKNKFDRKFKKVKGDEMLFITKEGKNGIELFNKRPTVIKTIDEFLNDVYYKKVNYDTFILFDKLGVMKMVAKLEKKADSIIIENSAKKKPYMKITLEDGIPVSLTSLVSNWNLTAIKSGVFKEYEVDLSKMISKSFSSKLMGSHVEFTDVDKYKKHYNLNGVMTFALPESLADAKPYKQNAFCKQELKKAKIKFKKIKIENSECVAKIKLKAKISELKQDILSELIKEHEQLKITKKIKFKKDSIVYGVL